jgi:hypothetical protein
MAAPSMTTPARTYFHSTTSSLRASATIIAFLRRPPLRFTRSSNHKVSADRVKICDGTPQLRCRQQAGGIGQIFADKPCIDAPAICRVSGLHNHHRMTRCWPIDSKGGYPSGYPRSFMRYPGGYAVNSGFIHRIICGEWRCVCGKWMLYLPHRMR